MTYIEIEAIAALRVQERQAEAAQGRLAKTASARAEHTHAWRSLLPTFSLRRSSPTTRAA